MKNMTVERLEQVIRVLEELPDGKRFSLNQWMVCGTIGCACGWAAKDPWFEQRGLKLVEDGDNFHGRCSYELMYKTAFRIDAAAMFFKIGLSDARFLFLPGEYARGSRSRRHVIRRIRQFIKDRQP